MINYAFIEKVILPSVYLGIFCASFVVVLLIMMRIFHISSMQARILNVLSQSKQQQRLQDSTVNRLVYQ